MLHRLDQLNRDPFAIVGLKNLIIGHQFEEAVVPKLSDHRLDGDQLFIGDGSAKAREEGRRYRRHRGRRALVEVPLGELDPESLASALPRQTALPEHTER